MRVIMTGGGTGGHVNPALAIADIIKSREPDSEILFVGTKRGIENRLVPQAGYPLEHIDVRGLSRSLSPANIRALWLAVTSVGKAKKLLRSFKPDVVIGTGGYVSWPPLKAASALGIPAVLHESNASPGVAVKMLKNKADIIFTNYEVTAKKLDGANVIRSGNPMRREIAQSDREEARRILGITGKYRNCVLSTGGSNGAERVNREVLEMMRGYGSSHPETFFMHAGGSYDYATAEQLYNEYGLSEYRNIYLCEYFYDMPQRLAAADLVINRAGAMTLSELAMLGKPAILIPSPNVADNHQYYNAKAMEDAGAAVMLTEDSLTPGKLAQTVDCLIGDPARLAEMGKNMKKFVVNDTNNLLYNEIKKLVLSKHL